MGDGVKIEEDASLADFIGIFESDAKGAFEATSKSALRRLTTEAKNLIRAAGDITSDWHAKDVRGIRSVANFKAEIEDLWRARHVDGEAGQKRTLKSRRRGGWQEVHHTTQINHGLKHLRFAKA